MKHQHKFEICYEAKGVACSECMTIWNNEAAYNALYHIDTYSPECGHAWRKTNTGYWTCFNCNERRIMDPMGKEKKPTYLQAHKSHRLCTTANVGWECLLCGASTGHAEVYKNDRDEHRLLKQCEYEVVIRVDHE